MTFKTFLRKLFCFTLIFSLPSLAGAEGSPQVPTVYKIGVIQVVEHPALDETRQGIRDCLTEEGFGDNLQWHWESAQGNPPLATQIAQKYRGQKVTLVVAIGTTAAQAALSVLGDGQIPLVFASVTDPASAKITGNNVTGVSNYVSLRDQFSVIKKIIPAKKRIGVIYNPGETNSAGLVAQMQAEGMQEGLDIIAVAAIRTGEVSTAAEGLIGKVDAIFINNDNTALAAINSVGQICRDNKIPLFASDGDSQQSKALAIIGADQYEIGRQAGHMIARILRGEVQTADMPVGYPAKMKVAVNSVVAQDLGILLPENLASP